MDIYFLILITSFLPPLFSYLEENRLIKKIYTYNSFLSKSHHFYFQYFPVWKKNQYPGEIHCLEDRVLIKLNFSLSC